MFYNYVILKLCLLSWETRFQILVVGVQYLSYQAVKLYDYD